MAKVSNRLLFIITGLVFVVIVSLVASNGFGTSSVINNWKGGGNNLESLSAPATAPSAPDGLQIWLILMYYVNIIYYFNTDIKDNNYDNILRVDYSKNNFDNNGGNNTNVFNYSNDYNNMFASFKKSLGLIQTQQQQNMTNAINIYIKSLSPNGDKGYLGLNGHINILKNLQTSINTHYNNINNNPLVKTYKLSPDDFDNVSIILNDVPPLKMYNGNVIRNYFIVICGIQKVLFGDASPTHNKLKPTPLLSYIRSKLVDNVNKDNYLINDADLKTCGVNASQLYTDLNSINGIMDTLNNFGGCINNMSYKNEFGCKKYTGS